MYSIADSSELNKFNLSSYCFTPKLINNFKKSLGDLPKNDKSDSFVIAQKLKSGHLPNECYINFNQLALQRLTRFRNHTMDSITHEKGYLTFVMKNSFAIISSLEKSIKHTDKTIADLLLILYFLQAFFFILFYIKDYTVRHFCFKFTSHILVSFLIPFDIFQSNINPIFLKYSFCASLFGYIRQIFARESISIQQ